VAHVFDIASAIINETLCTVRFSRVAREAKYGEMHRFQNSNGLAPDQSYLYDREDAIFQQAVRKDDAERYFEGVFNGLYISRLRRRGVMKSWSSNERKFVP